MVIVVEGKIVPKARPRINTKTKVAYTPKTTKEYEARIKKEYIEQNGVNELFKGLLELNVKFFFKIPKSYSRRRINEIKDKYCGNHKDIDNCIKSVMDGLLKVAYEDDKQVVKIKASKLWTIGNERTEFEIKEIDYDDGSN